MLGSQKDVVDARRGWHGGSQRDDQIAMKRRGRGHAHDQTVIGGAREGNKCALKGTLASL